MYKLQVTPISEAWTSVWPAGVAAGSSTLSQHPLASIEVHGGGLEAVRTTVKAEGVPLRRLEDDRGGMLPTARAKPFTVLC